MHAILEFLKQYQILALGGAGIITFFLREVPKKTFFFIWSQISTSLTLNSRHEAYYYLLEYLSLQKRININRNLSLSNEGYWSVGTDKQFKLGWGISMVRYNDTALLIDRTSDNVPGSDRPLEKLKITTFTRNNKVLTKLLDSAHAHSKTKEDLELYQSTKEGWESLGELQQKPLESVVLATRTKQRLLESLNSFISSESLYKNLAVSYKLNILLSGKPGTGKTSTILALANHLKRNVYFLKLNTLTPESLNKLLSRTSNGILVLEEIDTYSFSKSREEAGNEKERIIGLTLGDVLNTLDGLLTKQGNILIATTNYPEKLDPALIRDGRFDLKLELEHFGKEEMLQLIKRFYPKETLNAKYLPDNMVPSTLQKLLLENLNDFEGFLDALAALHKTTVS